jgi:uncharacterized protein (TIGR03437 family)
MKSYRALIQVAGFALLCASGFSQTPGFNTGQAARLVVGQNTFTTGDFGATNQLLGSPSGVAYANGTLWVADANRLGALPNNNRVLQFNDASTYPTPTQSPAVPGSTCGVCRGKASLVLGQPDFISSSLSLTQGGMRAPGGVATDGTVLAVADTDNNRILIWRSLPRSSGQPADVVIGQKDFTHGSTSVPPTATSLRGPEGVWISNGKLFVADTQDNRILIYNQIPTSNNAAADVVVGQPNFTTFVQQDLTQAPVPTAANNLQTPVSVTTDGTRMYVTDLGQNRILIFNHVPTTNGAAADLAVGQPDLTSGVDNNAARYNSTALDSLNAPTDVTPVLCASWGANSNGTALYPPRCAATLSFPRFALSDGTRLFVADGGNDRVLVFNTVPTANGVRADAVLGQPDEFNDAASRNPDGANAFQTPYALAWDTLNQNLYVSDTYNRRVVVFSPGVLNIPLSAVRNAASLEIYAIGSVIMGGTITAKDTVTVTIGSTPYLYNVVAADTLASVAENLAKAINKSPGDPNATAAANDATNTLILTARAPGSAGASVTYSVSVSTGATITPTPTGTVLSVGLQDPTSIAPGTLVQVYGQNLCDTSAAADFSQRNLPFSLAGCELYVDGNAAPLLYVSGTQFNVQMPLYFVDRTSSNLFIRTTHADGTVSVTAPIAVTIVPENPGIFAGPGTDPRPGLVFHASGSPNGVISVNGSIHAGDVGTITIGTATYSYTVAAADTLTTVESALISAINSAPDPNVSASAGNENNNIVLTALTPGAALEGLPVSVAVTGTSATLLLTATNATLCCDNVADSPVTVDNPAVPGEFLYVLATGLGPTTPDDQDTGQIFQGGSANPPAVPVDSILTESFSATLVSTTLVPGTVGVYKVLFQLSTAATTDQAAQMTIAQQFFRSNVVTFPIQVPGTVLISPTSVSRTRASRGPLR